DRGDVGRDVARVGPGHDPGRHDAAGSSVVDLVVDDLSDRALLEMLHPWAGERAVEVGADGPARARVGQRVAAPALADEQLLAAPDIRAAALGEPGLADAAAARGQQRRDPEDNQWRRERPQRLRGRLARGPDLLDRLVARRVDREDAVEAGDLEDLGDLPV